MLRGFGISKTAQGFDHVCLRVGLAAVNDVVNRLRAPEIRMLRLTMFGRDPAHVIVVSEEWSVAEITAQQAKLPKVIRDVLPDIGNGTVGTHNHLGVFVNGVFVPAIAVEARRITQQPWFLPSVSR